MEPELFKDPPQLHYWEGYGDWTPGGFNGPELKSLAGLIQQNFSSPRIIETGCGNSTIAFLLCNPQKVVSVSLAADFFQVGGFRDGVVFDRITDYCAQHSISIGPLNAIVGRSERELPRLVASGERFDFALIDGSHAWPAVFVDFCYVNAMVLKGGLIMLDDLQLHTVRELANLLLEQPGFDQEKQTTKSVIFRKTTDAVDMPEWIHQPYIVRRSTPKIEPSGLRRRLRGAAKALLRRARIA
jgi:hypothetical protein